MKTNSTFKMFRNLLLLVVGLLGFAVSGAGQYTLRTGQSQHYSITENFFLCGDSYVAKIRCTDIMRPSWWQDYFYIDNSSSVNITETLGRGSHIYWNGDGRFLGVEDNGWYSTPCDIFLVISQNGVISATTTEPSCGTPPQQ